MGLGGGFISYILSPVWIPSLTKGGSFAEAPLQKLMDGLLQVAGTDWEKAEMLIQNLKNRRLKLASWAGGTNWPLDIEWRKYGGGDCKQPWKLLQLEKPREECKDRNNTASETLKTASWSKRVFGKMIGKDFTMFKIQNLGAWRSIALWVHYIRLYPREYQTNADIKICNYLLPFY